MAEIKYWQDFELCRRLEAIVAILVLLYWYGFEDFGLARLLQFFQSLCYFNNDRRKCTLKIKYGLGSTTLRFKLTKIPIRD